MFTDGDLGMGAALQMFPGISHLLCIYHLGENLKVHTERLFPKKTHAAAKEAFGKAFKALMYHGFNDAEEAETTFDIKWQGLSLVHTFQLKLSSFVTETTTHSAHKQKVGKLS